MNRHFLTAVVIFAATSLLALATLGATIDLPRVGSTQVRNSIHPVNKRRTS